MEGLSARNLECMRAFAEDWPDEEFVQEVLARLPWYHHAPLEERATPPMKLNGPTHNKTRPGNLTS
ncbi:MAG: hypothetical protein H3C59_06365 [Burkholderiaceae bacterium]|nr:hypothetical protein [Burkholderiaceae bacterium]